MNGRGLRHCLCLFVLVFTAILDLSLISVLSTSHNTVSSPSTSSTSSTFPLLAVAYGAYGGDAALPCILHFGMFIFYQSPILKPFLSRKRDAIRADPNRCFLVISVSRLSSSLPPAYNDHDLLSNFIAQPSVLCLDGLDARSYGLRTPGDNRSKITESQSIK